MNRAPRRESARPWRSAGFCVSAQLAWLVSSGVGQTLTLHIEEALDRLGASPTITAAALVGWVLVPIACFAAMGLRALRSSPPSAGRSSGPPGVFRWSPAAAIVLATLGCAAFFLAHRDYLLHRFGPVREGVLYRSAQMGEATLRGTLARYGIRTLVVLRNASDVRASERALTSEAGVRFAHVPMDDTGAGVARFLEIMKDPSHYPVLAHCRHGVARSGVVSAIFRMEFDGWSNADALSEARRYGGYDTLGDGSDKRDFILSYERNHP